MRDYAERTYSFRKKSEDLGIVFTKRDFQEILTEKRNRSRYRDVLPLILEYLPKYDDSAWNHTFVQLLATPLAGEEGAGHWCKTFSEVNISGKRVLSWKRILNPALLRT